MSAQQPDLPGAVRASKVSSVPAAVSVSKVSGAPAAAGTQGEPAAPDVHSDAWLDEIVWGADGLVPVIAQDAASGRVLMCAWANRDALRETAQTGLAVYWSRSRRRRWQKGEESGHVQRVREMRLDCDADVVLLAIEQEGGIACHTGRERCFYRLLRAGQWVPTDPVLKDPTLIYVDEAGQSVGHPAAGGNAAGGNAAASHAAGRHATGGDAAANQSTGAQSAPATESKANRS